MNIAKTIREASRQFDRDQHALYQFARIAHVLPEPAWWAEDEEELLIPDNQWDEMLVRL